MKHLLLLIALVVAVPMGTASAQICEEIDTNNGIIVDYLTSRARKNLRATDRRRVIRDFNDDYATETEYGDQEGVFKLGEITEVQSGREREHLNSLFQGTRDVAHAIGSTLSLGLLGFQQAPDITYSKKVYAAEVTFYPCR